MRRPLHFHPGPLTILVAIVLCLIAGLAFGQVLSPGVPIAMPFNAADANPDGVITRSESETSLR